MSWKDLLARLLPRRNPKPNVPPSLPAVLHEIATVLDTLARMPHPDPSIPRRLRRICQELAEVEAGCRNPSLPPDALPTPPPTRLLQ